MNKIFLWNSFAPPIFIADQKDADGGVRDQSSNSDLDPKINQIS